MLVSLSRFKTVPLILLIIHNSHFFLFYFISSSISCSLFTHALRSFFSSFVSLWLYLSFSTSISLCVCACIYIYFNRGIYDSFIQFSCKLVGFDCGMSDVLRDRLFFSSSTFRCDANKRLLRILCKIILERLMFSKFL